MMNFLVARADIYSIARSILPSEHPMFYATGQHSTPFAVHPYRTSTPQDKIQRLFGPH